MTFKNWILKFRCVDWPIGDLANDIASDSQFPDGNDYDTIRDYLARKASSAALTTFEEVWVFFKVSELH